LADQAILIGGGAFGRELLSWAEAAHRAGRGLEVIGYLDDAGPVMDGYRGVSVPYLGKSDAAGVPDALLLIAIGTPSAKRAVAERFGGMGARFAGVVHPSAVVTDNALLAEGVVVGPHSYVANHAELGRLSAVNSLSGIGHDVRLGDFSTVSSGVDLMGGVVVEDEAFFGSGARVLPGVRVGQGARIGAGAIVVRNVKPGQTLYAAPAKKL
jgi:sugar O-acyltransferase (sialic acid O-acetyltransferase NeuD family)